MRQRARIGPIFLALLVGLALAPPIALADGKPVLVFGPETTPYGKTFGEWSAEWWRWAYSIPVDRNPLFDETGQWAGEGQSGPVWFLAGVFNESGSATRTASIPRGKALLFPILNAEWDNLCPPIDPPLDEAGLLAILNQNLDLVSDLSCEVDGKSIPGLFAYRVTSPAFSVTFPDNNIFQLFGCDHVTAGTYSPFVSGGYYVMLPPLSAGQHTIHFRGSIGNPAFFTLDVTYHLNIVNPTEVSNSSVLASVMPNPLNPQATLQYRMPRPGAVKVTLYDLNGRLIRTLVDVPRQEAGSHQVTIDGRDAQGQKMSSGIYFYRVEAAESRFEGRFTILK